MTTNIECPTCAQKISLETPLQTTILERFANLGVAFCAACLCVIIGELHFKPAAAAVTLPRWQYTNITSINSVVLDEWKEIDRSGGDTQGIVRVYRSMEGGFARDLQPLLDKASADGWEIANAVPLTQTAIPGGNHPPNTRTFGIVFILKRPVK